MDEKLYLDQYDDGSPNKGLDDEFVLSQEQMTELEGLVGKTLFLFNSLETALDRIIAEAVEERAYQPGYVVTSELSIFAKKVLVFKALYGMLAHGMQDKEFIKEFELLWKLLFKLKDIRNDIAHADWLEANSKYEVRLRISTDEKGPYAIIKEMPPKFLREKISELEDAIAKVEIFSEHKDNVITEGGIITEENRLKDQ